MKEKKTINIYILIIFNTETLRHIIIKDRTLSALIDIVFRNDLSSQKEAKKIHRGDRRRRTARTVFHKWLLPLYK